ncbi:MAG: hypothetical protein IPO16_14820 [Saprospiraceae bacterium]|nr:hypothetical protein [Saprospiraceae bacterium]
MATRVSIATGNFTAAATWGLVDAATANTTNSELASTLLTTTYVVGTTFTPGALTITHIGVKLATRSGTTGTMSIALDQGGATVAGTEVVINTADLPLATAGDLDGGWIFLKLASPVTLLAATLYGVKAKTSSSSQVTLFTSSGSNWSRLLVLNTTGAPAAGDDLIIAKEYTGAGTSNSFTVTMNNTASTDFGSTPTAANALIHPGVAIGSGGTLTWGTTASTNYLLKVSNSIVIYSGGTMNMGTTGTPCPRTSTMSLTFDCGTNVDYGLTVRKLGTWNAQGLSRTSGKDIYYCKLNTDEAVNSTSLGVDTDTGWLDNDVICVGTTTRVISQSETGALNGAAGASTLTVDGFAGAGGGLAAAHSGTSPLAAYIIMTTRNVKIYGASASLCAYINIRDTATVDCDWVEMYWLGSNTSTKRGVGIAVTTGTCTFHYCSRHSSTSSGSMGFLLSGATGSGVTISNNVIYQVVNGISVTATSGVATITNNIIMKGSAVHFECADSGSTYTDNVSIGSSSYGFSITENGNPLGTFERNTALAANNTNMLISGGIKGGTILDFIGYRSNGAGIQAAAASVISNLIIKNAILFGNTTCSVLINNCFNLTIDNLLSSGDTTYATTSGIGNFGTLYISTVKLINCDFSTVSGIKTAHTNDINVDTAHCQIMVMAINTKLAGTNEVATQSNLTENAFITSQKNDQTTGIHKTWKRYGTLQTETTTVHAGTTSMKCTPNNASFKLETSGAFGGFKVAILSGQTCTPTVYVYEDGSYNGARARLIVKRNDALGITADTVLDTATAASDAAWEALTGTTAAVTDNGTLEFVIDLDGTAGNLFVDTFSAVNA